MSATVAAALKKIAVALLTEPKVLKTILGIILGIIIIIIMPIVALLGLFNGSIEVDTDRLHQMVEQNMSAEQQARLQFVEDTMNEVEEKMVAAGYSAAKVKEAQVIYVLALSEHAYENGFADTLVGCFAAEQTDEQLIAAVNAAFGVQVDIEEFRNVIGGVRKTFIDISDYTDPTAKNNLDLVKWAIHAHESGWGYVWGTYGNILDDTLFEYKKEQYPDEVGGKAEYIEMMWLGGRTADCVGLIKGYAWLNADTLKLGYAVNGMPDISADSMYENAVESGTIDTIPEITGLAVWHEGHIGIYIGNGEVIHAANTNTGVVRNAIGDTAWTHWLKIPYINYVEETEGVS